MSDPYIQIMHPVSINVNTPETDIVNIDIGPLAVPESFLIGSKSCMGHIIEGREDQVSEYAIWLEDKIKEQDIPVCTALEEVFTKSMRGVILKTNSINGRLKTHGHVIRDVILELASN